MFQGGECLEEANTFEDAKARMRRMFQECKHTWDECSKDVIPQTRQILQRREQCWQAKCSRMRIGKLMIVGSCEFWRQKMEKCQWKEKEGEENFEILVVSVIE